MQGQLWNSASGKLKGFHWFSRLFGVLQETESNLCPLKAYFWLTIEEDLP